ncbi:MAG: aminotransferase class V-fold PLP-dependent enzyme, partial [Bacteroidota bacterium]
MRDFSHEFPATSDHTYLNTASCGLLSRTLTTWRHDHDQRLMEGGSMFRDLHKQHIREIRATIARFFSTSESNVALVPNFSFGWNTLLDGLPRDRKVLLLKGDYPSVNWPVEHRKFNTCYADIDEHMEQHIAQALETHRPDIFAISVVQYISGLKIDLQYLKDLKARFPDTLFVADGTQFLGTEVFDFDESPFDIIGASTYKWMLAGYGNAFFMIKDSAKQRIAPIAIGFNSADAKFSKENDIEFVGRLEPGHQDTLNYGSIAQSI